MHYPQLSALRDKDFDVLYLLSATSQVLAALAGFIFSASLIFAQLASGILPRSIHNILGWSSATYFFLFIIAILADLWFITEPDNELGVRMAFILSGLSMLLSMPYAVSIVHRVDPIWWAENLKNEVYKRLKSKACISSKADLLINELTELGKRALAANQYAAFQAVLERLTNIGLNTMHEQQHQHVASIISECIRDLGINSVINPVMSAFPLDSLTKLLDNAWLQDGKFIFDLYSNDPIPIIGDKIGKAIADIGISAYEINNFNITWCSISVFTSMADRVIEEESKGESIITEYYLAALLPHISALGLTIARGKNEELAFFVASNLRLIGLESYKHNRQLHFEKILHCLYSMSNNSQDSIATDTICCIWMVGIDSYTNIKSSYTSLVIRYLIRLSEHQNGERLVREGYKSKSSAFYCPIQGIYLDNKSRLAIWRDYETALLQSRSHSESISIRQKLSNMRKIRRCSDQR